MADPVDDIDSVDDFDAQTAFENILKAPPATEAAPETEIQPQPETQQASEPEANVDEVAEAPASEETASQPSEAAAPVQPQPVVSQQATPPEDPEAKAARDQLQSAVTYAKALLPQLQAQIMCEFSDIKTADDLYRVGEIDPNRYNRFVLAAQKMQSIQGQYQLLEKQASDARVASERAASPKIDWAAEKARLDKEIPELTDPVKGRELERQLNEFAKARNINPAGKTAAEIVILYEAFKATTGKAAQATALAEANKKAAKAPPVQKPGTARPANSKQDKAEEDFKRLQRTGSDRDAADVFRAILN